MMEEQMRTFGHKVLLTLAIVTLGWMLPAPLFAAAQDHVVSPAELHQAVVTQTQTRQENISKVETLFSSPRAEKALKSAHLDPVQVRKAVPTLSDAELGRLASQSEKARKDFAAGSLTNEQITYILIALGTAIIVLIATR
jgi:hypothetical protein